MPAPAPVAPAITAAPTAQTVARGQSARFSVLASGTAPLAYQWRKNGDDIVGANSSSYTTPPTAAADNEANFAVTVSNSAGSAASAGAALRVIGASAATGSDVLTYHNDNARSAQNLSETLLTPSTVNSGSFGLLKILPVDGLVDAQPLIATNLRVGATPHNVVYVATEHGSIDAFDADGGAALGHVSLLGAGESSSDNRGCDQVSPEIGITATPVIDRAAGANGTLYAVAMSKDGAGRYHQRLHALDLVTLSEQPGSPVEIQATYPGAGANSSGGKVVFDPSLYKERAALLLLNGNIYTTWASHCDHGLYTGWIIAYGEKTLAQTQVLNLTPNGFEGAIWQSGGGMAADSQGNFYALIANGTFDTTLGSTGMPASLDYGNAFVKISSVSPVEVVDYFAMHDSLAESQGDVDLGSGAPMLLPDQKDATGAVWHLAVGAGKDGHLYVVNRDDLGKFSTSVNGIWQDLPGALPGGIWSAPAYFNGSVYYADVGGTLKAFQLNRARLNATPASQSSTAFVYPGASPAVSANGAGGGIVWAVENSSPAVLHAYDASNLANEYYNSNQAPGNRDHFGNGNKFVTPTIANGKVYVGTPRGVAVFGLNP